MEGSLNAGAELDEPDTLAPVVVDHDEAISITPEEEVLTSLENQVLDLQNLADDIMQSHGMNQKFALEAQNLLPGFGSVPLGYYSKDLSATRFKVSLEELHQGIWALIGAAAAAIAVMLYKLYKWIWGDESSSSSSSDGGSISSSDIASVEKDATEKVKKVKDNVETLEKAKESVDKLEDQLKRENITKVDKDGKETVHVTPKNVVETYITDQERFDDIQKFLTARDPVFHDILANGPYSKIIKQTIPLFNEIAVLLKVKTENLKHIHDADKDDQHNQVIKNQHVHMLDELTKPVTLGDNKTLLELATDINEVLNRVKGETKVLPEMTLQEMMKATIDAYKNADIQRLVTAHAGSLEQALSMQKYMDQMKTELGNISTDGPGSSASEGVGSRLRNAVFAIGRDINGYLKLTLEMDYFLQSLHRLSNEAMGISNRVERAIVKDIADKGTTAPSEWKEETKKGKINTIVEAITMRRGKKK